MRQTAYEKAIDKTEKLPTDNLESDYLNIEYNSRRRYITYLLNLARFDEGLSTQEFVELHAYSKKWGEE